MNDSMPKRCGTIAIIGRPNVGKSTLINRILQQKLSITCRKPQTTRHQIVGIKTEGNVQAIYVDTPGIDQRYDKALNRQMNKAATSTITGVDVVLWVVDQSWTEQEDAILERLKAENIPVILVLNKSDRVKPKSLLLPWIEENSKRMDFAAVLPISAKNGMNVAELEAKAASFLPEMDFIYDEEQFTDRSERFLVAEIVREKLMRSLGQELPYALTVETELFKYDAEADITDIAVTIYVERPSQKAIVIGKKGQGLKQVGKEARADIEKLIQTKVYLQCWVKVKQGWSDDERALRQFGLTGQ